jgi:hypothetical protein
MTTYPTWENPHKHRHLNPSSIKGNLLEKNLFQVKIIIFCLFSFGAFGEKQGPNLGRTLYPPFKVHGACCFVLYMVHVLSCPIHVLMFCTKTKSLAYFASF